MAAISGPSQSSCTTYSLTPASLFDQSDPGLLLARTRQSVTPSTSRLVVRLVILSLSHTFISKSNPSSPSSLSLSFRLSPVVYSDQRAQSLITEGRKLPQFLLLLSSSPRQRLANLHLRPSQTCSFIVIPIDRPRRCDSSSALVQ
ncbi:hypothetical protein SODALDRAFT_357391 [Sodiomyces alkalinus F11]|uniref:Uncharacterized protein n=1 Tax=Sodiomyces alkalinus (strain CBS 110278 / VKM F-3762 / F11) TaxID=1314773 RepID=A0A3N2Q3R3_SODAK|nr:hypothetical protein SODALDRAFT_357391 [Sodiomyces alkalinus F11]ROT41357.1 hypothetical protein SODALDRAFT_357391 [Sodiomyces alkalinus F11]